MTTPIQAAIEALTLAMTICDAVPTRAQNCDDETLAHLGKLVNISTNGATGYAVIRDALAALQAAPAPGSIDTAEFQRLAHDYRRHQTDADYTALVAHIDAHIAQRAASGDAAPLGYVDGQPVFVGAELEQRVRDGWVRHNAQESWRGLPIDWKNDMRWPAPAPIADEVAGDTVAWLVTLPGGELELGAAYFDKDEADDYVENHAKEGCYLTELVERPAAPKASAPDAAAGDLPPLPEYCPEIAAINSDEEERAKKYARVYALADRAARAAAAPAEVDAQKLDDRYRQGYEAGWREGREEFAAAPAGHAEPVAWANVRESDGVVVGLSQHPEDTARWMNPRALVFAAL